MSANQIDDASTVQSAKPPKVGVCIVNYNSFNLTHQCVSSLRHESVHSIVIIDNSADSGELERLRNLASVAPQTTILSSFGNVGFGTAVNTATNRALQDCPDLDYVWILNPDIVVKPGSLQLLCEAAESVPGSIVSPLILSGNLDDEFVWFAGGRIDRRSGSVAHNFYGSKPADLRLGKLEPTEFVTGAAPFVPSTTWQTLGGFSDDLFLYWEDVEMSLRAQQKGINQYVATAAVVWHAEGGTSGEEYGSRSAVYYKYTARNRLIVMSQVRPLRDLLLRHEGARSTLAFALRPMIAERQRRLAKTGAALTGTFQGIYLAAVRGNGSVSDNSIGSANDVATEVETLLSQHNGRIVTWLNHYSIQRANWSALSRCSLVGVDGTLLQLAMYIGGMKIRRSSADLVLPRYLAAEHRAGKTVALVGGRPGVAEIAATRVPNVAYTCDGFAGIEDLPKLAEEISARGSRTVVLSIGPGLQDEVAVRLAKLLPETTVFTAGGWVDQLARRQAYFPWWAHRFRLGWAVRVAREPRRLLRRYTLDALAFAFLAATLIRRLAAISKTRRVSGSFVIVGRVSVPATESLAPDLASIAGGEK